MDTDHRSVGLVSMVKAGTAAAGRWAGTLAAALGLLFLFNFLLMFWQLMVITTPYHYETVVQHRWLRADLIEHFPASIPASVPADFFYIGGFLQGGGMIELRLRLSSEAMLQIERAYRARAIATYDAAGEVTSNNVSVDVFKKTGFKTTSFAGDARTAYGTRPATEFETLVLQAPAEFNANHPEGAGISIDRANNEVIYWAEGG